MGLVLTGKLVRVTSKPYDMADRDNPGERIVGTSHKARVLVGGGDFIDVKLSEDNLRDLPRQADLPDDGVPVEWAVEFGFGKIAFVADKAPATGTRVRSAS